MFIVWSIITIALTLSAIFIIFYILRTINLKEALIILKNGFQEGLRGCGFILRQQPSQSYDLYKWEVIEQGPVCSHCFDYTAFPAKDIAQWLKEGLPSETTQFKICGDHCRCGLMPYQDETTEHFNK